MTCIVGVVDKGKVWVGGDSAGVSTGDYGLTVRADRKVFTNGAFVMGFTTSFRMGQLLAYALKPPRQHPKDDVMHYMVTEFINSVRQCLKDGGFAQKQNEEEHAGTFLVGYAGRLFQVYGDYQVAESTHGYSACGCGEHIAIGSLHETKSLPAKKRIQRALSAAEAFSAGVRGPFHIESGGTA